MQIFDEDGQLLLAAAFSIAILVLVSTVLLNSIIFTSNIAADSGSDTMIYKNNNLIQATTNAYQNAYEHDIGLNQTYLSDFESNLKRMYAQEGYLISTRQHDIFTPYFTETGMPGGAGDWIVVKNVKTVKNMVFEIESFDGTDFEVKALDSNNNSIWSISYSYDGSFELDNVDESFDNVDEIGNSTIRLSNGNDPSVHNIVISNGSQVTGYYLIEGTLDNSVEYHEQRGKMINVTFNINSARHSTSTTIPVSLPFHHSNNEA